MLLPKEMFEGLYATIPLGPDPRVWCYHDDGHKQTALSNKETDPRNRCFFHLSSALLFSKHSIWM
ncbi:hypothetical protein J4Q44_G00076020 [Coregonus suidteri]|uniref:Uncharacterized protein n=1 Tax=Coregonus suidteri TaxID=861788 RepID=A0AAN8MF95_9TELE